MEQIRLDPLSPYYTKRDARPTTASGDVFASLLDDKLKDGGNVKLANDPELGIGKADSTVTRDRRAAYIQPRRFHQTSADDQDVGEQNAAHLKASQALQTKIARHERDTVKEKYAAKTAVATDTDAAYGYGVATAPSTAAGSTANSTASPQDTPCNNGQSAGDSPDGETQAQSNPAQEIAEASATAPALTLTAVTPQQDDTAAPGAAAAATPEEAVAMAQAAVAAAATTLPDTAFRNTAAPAELEPEAGLPTPTVPDAKAKSQAVAVNDNTALADLADIGADQAIAVEKAAQPTQSAGVVFRQSSGGAKAKPQGPGQGAADPQTHQSNQIAPQKPLAATHIPVTDASSGESERAATGVSAIDGEFGMTDQGGMAGWAQHLTPNAIGKNASFIANLRQHLQNLPTHEQVAVHIQRAVNDRLGKLTVDLAPVELGRIQVKLKIDEENRVSATVLVERPGTLDLLQRDSRALERALQEAGLRTDSGSLSFTLQGGGTGDFDQDQGFSSSGGPVKTADGVENPANAANSARPSVIETADGLVDVEV